MSRHLTEKEVQQEYVRAMGPELGSVFFRLRNECVTLHWKWEEFVTLFGTSPERIELLNEAAGAFFWIVQDTLWDDVLLLIARLTGPPDSGKGKDNLTLQKLPGLVAAPLQAEVETLVKEASQRGRLPEIGATEGLPTPILRSRKFAPSIRPRTRPRGATIFPVVLRYYRWLCATSQRCVKRGSDTRVFRAAN